MPDTAASLESLDNVLVLAHAENAGISRWTLATLVRLGAVRRLQRGTYAKVVDQRPEEAWQARRRRHLQRCQQALEVHPGHALSHQSAALARDWPVLVRAHAPVHLTAVAVAPRSRQLPGTVLHHSDALENEVETVAGYRVLTAARTVADCLRTMPRAESVAVADGAVRAGATTLVEVSAVLETQRRWRGRPRALDAVPLVDPRRETWLESFSFVRLHDLGVTLPTPQVEIYDEHGHFVARADGMWVRDGVVAECDGTGKYLLDERGSRAPDPARTALKLVDERRRERSIEDLGLDVVRWGTSEITRYADAVAKRVQHTRAHGDLSRFRGRLRVDGAWLDVRSLR